MDVAAMEALPWTTPPGELGSAVCGWCHRAIYRPALPCSEHPPAGLADLATAPGQGERCKYEMLTRTGATRAKRVID